MCWYCCACLRDLSVRVVRLGRHPSPALVSTVSREITKILWVAHRARLVQPARTTCAARPVSTASVMGRVTSCQGACETTARTAAQPGLRVQHVRRKAVRMITSCAQSETVGTRIDTGVPKTVHARHVARTLVPIVFPGQITTSTATVHTGASATRDTPDRRETSRAQSVCQEHQNQRYKRNPWMSDLHSENLNLQDSLCMMLYLHQNIFLEDLTLQHASVVHGVCESRELELHHGDPATGLHEHEVTQVQ